MSLQSVSATHCPACGQDEAINRHARPANDQPGEWISVIECDDCNFAWQWPLGRSIAESVTVFEQAYAAGDDDGYFAPEQRKAVANLQVDYLQEIGLSGRLLDIGCGDGTFAITAAERGFDVVGLDVALPSIARISEGDLPCMLVRGTMDDLPPDLLFDVVTLWDVIEHVENPSALVMAARARLKTGGWLVIETGNYASADRVESGNDWWCWQKDHRWYFNPDVVQKILYAQGFGRFQICDRLLRPGLRAQNRGMFLDLIRYAKMTVRQPLRVVQTARTFRSLRRARMAGSTAGLGIFTLAAQWLG